MNPAHRLPLALLAALLLLVPFLAACESKVTQANYNQITVGMTQSKVESILGAGTEETPDPGFGITGSSLLTGGKASKERVFTWKEGSATVTIVFVDGKVVQKQEHGL